MRTFLCEVDHTGLRRFIPEELIPGDEPGHLARGPHRPSTAVWALLADDDAESIRAEVAADHPGDACGLLLNRAVELVSFGAVSSRTFSRVR
jgi:hypothetical protein